jgi:hypothetical protein
MAAESVMSPYTAAVAANNARFAYPYFLMLRRKIGVGKISFFPGAPSQRAGMSLQLSPFPRWEYQ